MAAARRHVFVEKVLKRLFPQDPRGREGGAPLPAASETPPEEESCRRVPPSAGGGTGTPRGQRLYTVALPPEGYVPAPPEPEPEAPSCEDSADSEAASSGQDAADEEPRDQPKRRRIRKHKSKTKASRPSGAPAEGAEAEAEGQQPRPAGGPPISRNRRRKLKKKQQVQRKRAAGLLTKAAGLSFLYAPDGGGSEPGDSSEGAGGGGSEAEDAGEEPGGARDAEQDGGGGPGDQAQAVLEFLKSTQELYFYDGVSRGADPALLAASEALLRGLAAGSVPPSDLRALGHMKALLLLQDPGALRGALQAFEEHCTLPPDQARVVSAFFSYWLTHILPESPGAEPGAAPEES